MVEVLKGQAEPIQKKIFVDPDPDRVAQDLANLAICIHLTEELARLSFHTASLKKLLSKNGVIGQKINFFCRSSMERLVRVVLNLKIYHLLPWLLI